jgi:hypothetical protein
MYGTKDNGVLEIWRMIGKEGDLTTNTQPYPCPRIQTEDL